MSDCRELCKVGDVVYRLTKSGIEAITITKIEHYPHTVYRGENKHQSYFNRAFGKSLFQTKEEAEAESQRREKIAGKKVLLQSYERTLNEELGLGDHYIVK